MSCNGIPKGNLQLFLWRFVESVDAKWVGFFDLLGVCSLMQFWREALIFMGGVNVATNQKRASEWRL
jgi:hypothetical protein